MAKLQAPDGAQTQVLFARTLVGRSRPCLLRIDYSVVSGEHASIIWNGDKWIIRDLASKNGTFVDGKRLSPGIAHDLQVGSTLGFGGPEREWQVLELEAPQMMAIGARSGRKIVAQGGILALPSEDQPELTIFEVQQEGWCVESESGQRDAIEDLDTVQCDGETWRIQLPIEAEGTPLVQANMTLRNTQFLFRSWPDREAVGLDLVCRGDTISLIPREHLKILLQLARFRSEESAPPQRPGFEPGWRTLEELAADLKMSVNAVNVSTFRARRQLTEAGLVDASRIVQVRRGLRRFGADLFEVQM